MTRTVLVVGLGQIGMGYDYALDPRAFALTHASAFAGHPEFRLAGGVDPSPDRRRQFEGRYGVPAFAAAPEALRALGPDVVALATPTSIHAESLAAVLAAASPAAILCEKPLSMDLGEARHMLAECESRGIRLYVNYFRRSEPGVAQVSARLSAGAIGLPVKGVCWYTKGLFNNGSHYLNLLQHWLGPVRASRVIRPGRLWAGTDPEPDVEVTFEGGELLLLAAQEERFSHHAIEFVAANGRLRYEQGGERIFWQKAIPDPTYAGYTRLDADAETITTDFARAQRHVADQLAESLEGGAARICTGAEALATLETLTTIRNQL